MEPDAVADPLLSRVLAGTYRLEAVLGRGAMGTVYRAVHTLLGEPYAVKVLHPELADDESVRRRFLQEARALTRFVHRNAVAVRHCGEEQGLVFLAMDLCAGETLEALLAREGRLPPGRATALALQILAALAEAHRAGIVHRDLKPANVMVEPPPPGGVETARVLDFGLSRLLAEGREVGRSRISSLGEVVGTVAYMSPEQALGQDLDGRSDLFSLGVMLYEMVEGRHPFGGGTLASVITRLLEVERLLEVPAGGPPAGGPLAPVLARALARERDQRFPDAEAFAAALHDPAGVGSARRPPAAARARAPGRARPARRVVAGALLLALLLAVGLWAFVLPASWGPWRGGGGAAEGARLRARGLEALEQGRPSEAIQAFEALLAQGPVGGDLRLALAQARIAAGDPAAESDLLAAERALPGDARVAVARGRFLHRVKHDPGAALAAFLAALTRDRASQDARLSRLALLLDPAHAPWFQARREDRFELAEADVAALEALAPDDAAVPLARSRLERTRAEAGPSDAEARLAAAETAARAAAAADAAWHAGPDELARVLLARAGRHRLAGRPAEALTLSRAGVEALLEARRRQRAAPGHRGQALVEAALVRETIRARVHAGDAEGLVADAQELARLMPGEPDTLREQAQTLRMAGDLEAALPFYEALRDVAPDAGVLSDLAFCHQRLGLGELAEGRRAAGLERLERAQRAYDEALRLAPRSAVILAYRGQTALLRARWDPAEQEQRLNEARADLEAALARAAGDSERNEVVIRLAALRVAQGRVAEAAGLLGDVVGRDLALNAAFHGAYARCLLMQALVAPAGGPERARLLALALDQVERARERSGAAPGPALLLGAQVAALAGDGARARELLVLARAPGGLPDENASAEAALWAWLVGEEADPLRTGARGAPHLARRADELRAGRDLPSPGFYQALAEALEAAGTTSGRALAEDARRLATRVPP